MLKEHPKGVIILVKVTPKSGKNLITGWENDELKVRLNAVPEKGAANAELIKFLSKTFKLPKSRIILLRGDTSRHKQILLEGSTKKEIEKSLP
ncbi:MAG: hypothetical protein ACI9S8_000101 [Chlamydiales bacterium]|jgi:uncharacterized protein (TIGR00251 family)